MPYFFALSTVGLLLRLLTQPVPGMVPLATKCQEVSGWSWWVREVASQLREEREEKSKKALRAGRGGRPIYSAITELKSPFPDCPALILCSRSGFLPHMLHM